MPIFQYQGRRPAIEAGAFIFDNAVIIGDVRIGAGASVWPFVTIRGDNEPIIVGAGSNVQESCVLHTDPGFPLTIGSNVTVGHQAMLHGCTIGAGSLIGIQAVVLNGARIGRNCLVGAGALITEGKVIPDNSLVIGAPARVARALTEKDIAGMHADAAKYLARAATYRSELVRID
jgi:carbonic anhydrase/acetyltransferase-like protein (isoleucine patch superfamily)